MVNKISVRKNKVTCQEHNVEEKNDGCVFGEVCRGGVIHRGHGSYTRNVHNKMYVMAQIFRSTNVRSRMAGQCKGLRNVDQDFKTM